VFGISDEPIPAAVGTKENGLIAAKHAGWRELPFDLHPAHRVDRVPGAAPKAESVSIEPVERHEDTQEDQVEVRRVVPLEGRLDDRGWMGGGNQARRPEQKLG